MAVRIRIIAQKVYTDSTDADVTYTDYQGVVADKTLGLSRAFDCSVATFASDSAAQEKNKTALAVIAVVNDVFGLSLPNSTPVRLNFDVL